MVPLRRSAHRPCRPTRSSFLHTRPAIPPLSAPGRRAARDGGARGRTGAGPGFADGARSFAGTTEIRGRFGSDRGRAADLGPDNARTAPRPALIRPDAVSAEAGSGAPPAAMLRRCRASRTVADPTPPPADPMRKRDRFPGDRPTAAQIRRFRPAGPAGHGVLPEHGRRPDSATDEQVRLGLDAPPRPFLTASAAGLAARRVGGCPRASCEASERDSDPHQRLLAVCRRACAAEQAGRPRPRPRPTSRDEPGRRCTRVRRSAVVHERPPRSTATGALGPLVALDTRFVGDDSRATTPRLSRRGRDAGDPLPSGAVGSLHPGACAPRTVGCRPAPAAAR